MAPQIFPSKTFFFLAVLLAVAMASSGYCTDYYVDGNSGNDDAAGTSQNPWKTISHAISKASGTDTIYVKYATYNESLSFAPMPKRNISLVGIADGDAKPIICSASPGTHTITLTNYRAMIKGLEITGASNANGINCNASSGTNDAEIMDCKLHGNSLGVHATTAGSTDECSPYIHNNFICSNTTHGIGVMVYACPTIDGNYIYDNGNGSEGSGGIGNCDNSCASIINNIIYDNDLAGISIIDNANPKIVNNIITGHNRTASNSAAIRVRHNEGISSVMIVNNIITKNECGLRSQGAQSCSGNDYNDVWNNSFRDYFGFAKGANDISGDPLFVDPENRGYRLSASSPCIDKGTSNGAPDKDIDGRIRPQGGGYDMGAYEYREDVATLADAILALKVLAGIGPSHSIEITDINNDGKIGLEEVIYILQKISGLRQ